MDMKTVINCKTFFQKLKKKNNDIKQKNKSKTKKKTKQ